MPEPCSPHGNNKGDKQAWPLHHITDDVREFGEGLATSLWHIKTEDRRDKGMGEEKEDWKRQRKMVNRSDRGIIPPVSKRKKKKKTQLYG